MCLLLLEGIHFIPSKPPSLPPFSSYFPTFFQSLLGHGLQGCTDKNLDTWNRRECHSIFLSQEMVTISSRLILQAWDNFKFHTNFLTLLQIKFKTCILVRSWVVAFNTINSTKRSRAGSCVNQTKQPCTFILHFIGQNFPPTLFASLRLCNASHDALWLSNAILIRIT